MRLERRPHCRAQAGRFRSTEAVGHHHTLDHVGEHSSPGALTSPYGDDRMSPTITLEGPVDTIHSGGRPERRHLTTPFPGNAAERSGCGSEANRRTLHM